MLEKLVEWHFSGTTHMSRCQIKQKYTSFIVTTSPPSPFPPLIKFLHFLIWYQPMGGDALSLGR